MALGSEELKRKSRNARKYGEEEGKEGKEGANVACRRPVRTNKCGFVCSVPADIGYQLEALIVGLACQL